MSIHDIKMEETVLGVVNRDKYPIVYIKEDTFKKTTYIWEIYTRGKKDIYLFSAFRNCIGNRVDNPPEGWTNRNKLSETKTYAIFREYFANRNLGVAVVVKDKKTGNRVFSKTFNTNSNGKVVFDGFINNLQDKRSDQTEVFMMIPKLEPGYYYIEVTSNFLFAPFDDVDQRANETGIHMKTTDTSIKSISGIIPIIIPPYYKFDNEEPENNFFYNDAEKNWHKRMEKFEVLEGTGFPDYLDQTEIITDFSKYRRSDFVEGQTAMFKVHIPISLFAYTQLLSEDTSLMFLNMVEDEGEDFLNINGIFAFNDILNNGPELTRHHNFLGGIFTDNIKRVHMHGTYAFSYYDPDLPLYDNLLDKYINYNVPELRREVYGAGMFAYSAHMQSAMGLSFMRCLVSSFALREYFALSTIRKYGYINTPSTYGDFDKPLFPDGHRVKDMSGMFINHFMATGGPRGNELVNFYEEQIELSSTFFYHIGKLFSNAHTWDVSGGNHDGINGELFLTRSSNIRDYDYYSYLIFPDTRAFDAIKFNNLNYFFYGREIRPFVIPYDNPYNPYQVKSAKPSFTGSLPYLRSAVGMCSNMIGDWGNYGNKSRFHNIQSLPGFTPLDDWYVVPGSSPGCLDYNPDTVCPCTDIMYFADNVDTLIIDDNGGNGTWWLENKFKQFKNIEYCDYAFYNVGTAIDWKIFNPSQLWYQGMSLRPNFIPSKKVKSFKSMFEKCYYTQRLDKTIFIDENGDSRYPECETYERMFYDSYLNVIDNVILTTKGSTISKLNVSKFLLTSYLCIPPSFTNGEVIYINDDGSTIYDGLLFTPKDVRSNTALLNFIDMNLEDVEMSEAIGVIDWKLKEHKFLDHTINPASYQNSDYTLMTGCDIIRNNRLVYFSKYDRFKLIPWSSFMHYSQTDYNKRPKFWYSDQNNSIHRYGAGVGHVKYSHADELAGKFPKHFQNFVLFLPLYMKEDISRRGGIRVSTTGDRTNYDVNYGKDYLIGVPTETSGSSCIVYNLNILEGVTDNRFGTHKEEEGIIVTFDVHLRIPTIVTISNYTFGNLDNYVRAWNGLVPTTLSQCQMQGNLTYNETTWNRHLDVNNLNGSLTTTGHINERYTDLSIIEESNLFYWYAQRQEVDSKRYDNGDSTNRGGQGIQIFKNSTLDVFPLCPNGCLHIPSFNVSFEGSNITKVYSEYRLGQMFTTQTAFDSTFKNCKYLVEFNIGERMGSSTVANKLWSKKDPWQYTSFYSMFKDTTSLIKLYMGELFKPGYFTDTGMTNGNPPFIAEEVVLDADDIYPVPGIYTVDMRSMLENSSSRIHATAKREFKLGNSMRALYPGPKSGTNGNPPQSNNKYTMVDWRMSDRGRVFLMDRFMYKANIPYIYQAHDPHVSFYDIPFPGMINILSAEDMFAGSSYLFNNKDTSEFGQKIPDILIDNRTAIKDFDKVKEFNFKKMFARHLRTDKIHEKGFSFLWGLPHKSMKVTLTDTNAPSTKKLNMSGFMGTVEEVEYRYDPYFGDLNNKDVVAVPKDDINYYPVVPHMNEYRAPILDLNKVDKYIHSSLSNNRNVATNRVDGDLVYRAKWRSNGTAMYGINTSVPNIRYTTRFDVDKTGSSRHKVVVPALDILSSSIYSNSDTFKFDLTKLTKNDLEIRVNMKINLAKTEYQNSIRYSTFPEHSIYDEEAVIYKTIPKILKLQEVDDGREDNTNIFDVRPLNIIDTDTTVMRWDKTMPNDILTSTYQPHIVLNIHDFKNKLKTLQHYTELHLATIPLGSFNLYQTDKSGHTMPNINTKFKAIVLMEYISKHNSIEISCKLYAQALTGNTLDENPKTTGLYVDYIADCAAYQVNLDSIPSAINLLDSFHGVEPNLKAENEVLVDDKFPYKSLLSVNMNVASNKPIVPILGLEDKVGYLKGINSSRFESLTGDVYLSEVLGSPKHLNKFSVDEYINRDPAVSSTKYGMMGMKLNGNVLVPGIGDKSGMKMEVAEYGYGQASMLIGLTEVITLLDLIRGVDLETPNDEYPSDYKEVTIKNVR